MADVETGATQGVPEGEAAPQPAPTTAPETGTEQTPPTAAQPETPPEPEKPKQVPWFQRRIDELTRDKWEERRRADALTATLEALRRGQPPAEGQTQQQTDPARPADVETLATQKAKELVAQQRFDDDCNKAYDAGKTKYTDFDEAVTTLRMVGAMRQDVIDAALATDSAPDVLYHLGKNPDEAARILSLPPTRMAVELVKVAQTAAKPKPVSSAPAPIKPIDGGARVETDPDNMSMADWVKWREAQLRKS